MSSFGIAYYLTYCLCVICAVRLIQQCLANIYYSYYVPDTMVRIVNIQMKRLDSSFKNIKVYAQDSTYLIPVLEALLNQICQTPILLSKPRSGDSSFQKHSLTSQPIEIINESLLCSLHTLYYLKSGIFAGLVISLGRR